MAQTWFGCRCHVFARTELQLDLTQQLQDIFVQMSLSRHAQSPSRGKCSGTVLGGEGQVLFVGGVMSLTTIAALSSLVLIEKLMTRGELVAKLGGVLFCLWGVSLLV